MMPSPPALANGYPENVAYMLCRLITVPLGFSLSEDFAFRPSRLKYLDLNPCSCIFNELLLSAITWLALRLAIWIIAFFAAGMTELFPR